MTEPPETIEFDSIDLGDPRLVERMSYIVMGSDVYRVNAHDYGGDRYLELVDQIPDEHWERYGSEHDGGGRTLYLNWYHCSQCDTALRSNVAPKCPVCNCGMTAVAKAGEHTVGTNHTRIHD